MRANWLLVTKKFILSKTTDLHCSNSFYGKLHEIRSLEEFCFLLRLMKQTKKFKLLTNIEADPSRNKLKFRSDGKTIPYNFTEILIKYSFDKWSNIIISNIFYILIDDKIFIIIDHSRNANSYSSTESYSTICILPSTMSLDSLHDSCIDFVTVWKCLSQNIYIQSLPSYQLQVISPSQIRGTMNFQDSQLHLYFLFRGNCDTTLSDSVELINDRFYDITNQLINIYAEIRHLESRMRFMIEKVT